ncbi:DUF4350 domain-containing protein [Pyrococcus sp. ST04]|uniref:DUF4350 domain-containing protein n=1 Tax=Pyrococcus sp. ST04 TaxID=1183377 RepID=UPI0002605AB9|nr:DUF4350 domain-containing protein [Pyrococcus sp. ST04]AFK22122.1 hypothetical protein Py04_0520 [Pyrococcus sp. ST04]
MRRALYITLMIFGIMIIIMPISLPVFTTTSDFSVFNPSWIGVSQFGKMLFAGGKVYPVLVPFNSFNLREKEGTLIIIAPDLSYSSFEIEEIKEFVRGGNTLILMDDFGTGNEILEGLNLSVRFSRKMPVDIFYMKDYHFPVVVKINDERLSAGVRGILLNVPSVIEYPNGTALTSSVSMLGRNFKEYPILVTLKYGNGNIVLFSDPSVFTNEMIKYNRRFVENFIKAYVKYPVYIDEAHHSNFNLVQMGTVVIRRNVNKITIFYIIASISFLALFIESGLAYKILAKALSLVFGWLFKKEKEDIRSIVGRLKKEGYDENVLLRIINGIEKARRLGGGYGRKEVS